MSRLFRSSNQPEDDPTPNVTSNDDLRPQTVRIFALVGEAIAGATHALLANDRELAKRVVEADILIDELVNKLVSTAETRLLDSDDLDVEGRRELLILLRILPEVERNGDLAEHVARRAARGLGSEMSPRSRGLIAVSYTHLTGCRPVTGLQHPGASPRRNSNSSSGGPRSLTHVRAPDVFGVL